MTLSFVKTKVFLFSQYSNNFHSTQLLHEKKESQSRGKGIFHIRHVIPTQHEFRGVWDEKREERKVEDNSISSKMLTQDSVRNLRNSDIRSDFNYLLVDDVRKDISN